MAREVDSYVYEAKSMIQFILEGHNKAETAREFDVKEKTIDRRLQLVGCTYASLVEFREGRKKKQGS